MAGEPKYSGVEADSSQGTRTEEETVRDQGEGWLMVNTITGKTTRILSEYDRQVEEKMKSYELIPFTWEEEEEEVFGTLL